MLVDTHCHLNFDSFNNDRDLVLNEANKVGVTKILNPGIDLETSRQAVSLAECYKSVYAAVGIHPNEISNTVNPDLNEINQLAGKAKVVAIGEIGLDYYWNKSSKETQIDAFEKQLALAETLKLPVIIHNREATEDVLSIITNWQKNITGSKLAEMPGVLHSFAYGLNSALAAIEANFMIGITGPITFKKNTALQSVVADLPLSHLLIETDSPFLTPHPYRGKRNEPARVKLVAEKIAEIKRLSFDLVCEITSKNSEKLFGW